MIQAVAIVIGILTFSIGMALFHAALVGAFEGNTVLIVVAATLFSIFLLCAYQHDRGRKR
jgi:K+ transporter